MSVAVGHEPEGLPGLAGRSLERVEEVTVPVHSLGVWEWRHVPTRTSLESTGLRPPRPRSVLPEGYEEVVDRERAGGRPSGFRDASVPHPSGPLPSRRPHTSHVSGDETFKGRSVVPHWSFPDSRTPGHGTGRRRDRVEGPRRGSLLHPVCVTGDVRVRVEGEDHRSKTRSGPSPIPFPRSGVSAKGRSTSDR